MCVCFDVNDNVFVVDKIGMEKVVWIDFDGKWM